VTVPMFCAHANRRQFNMCSQRVGPSTETCYIYSDSFQWSQTTMQLVLELFDFLCNAEVIGDGDSSVQSSGEWECLASHDDELICLLCLEDSCTMITHVQYMQYYRDLSRHLGHMPGNMSRPTDMLLPTTEAELVATYMESMEDEITIVEQLMSTTQHVFLVIKKLIKDGLILVVKQGELPEDRILANST
jgi:hypothetical protein